MLGPMTATLVTVAAAMGSVLSMFFNSTMPDLAMLRFNAWAAGVLIAADEMF